eukprot:6214792-Pleurochrysis_carterae.AAC.4
MHKDGVSKQRKNQQEPPEAEGRDMKLAVELRVSTALKIKKGSLKRKLSYEVVQGRRSVCHMELVRV